ncbi:MAG: purine/pyrimidine permease [Thermodesulfobacteriota bacterium]|jgi:NCS2 family nucleobase:cation symporter-2|nr:MAG: purine/pyrimidine permease [Thermodesulfobacteriota bacterium]
MPKKPANLIYAVDENPPVGITLLQGIQHVFVLAVYFIFPVIVVNSVNGTNEEAATIIKMSMIVMGLTTIIQALSKGPVGSGYLAPDGNGPAYLSSAMLAAKTGGISLIFGMTLVSACFKAVFSRLVNRLQFLFPPEVVGLVVTMVGIEIIPLGITRFFGLQQSGGAIDPGVFLVAMATYATMVGINIWGKGWLRLYPILIGMAVGYLSSYLSGILTPSDLRHVTAESWISMPHFAAFGWSFDISLLFPFLIASLCSSLKTIGDLTMCQKINDSEWKRSDMKSIGRGILADSLGDTLSGLIGSLGQTTSSSNIGFSMATGVTSRRIAFAIGGILCLLAFLPKLAQVFVIMPRPVMGAILIFVANFMILAGIQIIATRMLDVRKIFVIGTSVIFGLSVFLFPKAYSNVPALLHPIFSSALSLATISVIVLNLIFRIGIAKRNGLVLDTKEKEVMETLRTFMENQGGAWGARREVIKRAEYALSEFMESLIGLQLTEGPVSLEVSFEEMSLDLSLNYKGRPLEFPPQVPSAADLLEDKTAVFRLSGFIIKNYVDRIKTVEKDGRCRVMFHFDH